MGIYDSHNSVSHPPPQPPGCCVVLAYGTAAYRVNSLLQLICIHHDPAGQPWQWLLLRPVLELSSPADHMRV